MKQDSSVAMLLAWNLTVYWDFGRKMNPSHWADDCLSLLASQDHQGVTTEAGWPESRKHLLSGPLRRKSADLCYKPSASRFVNEEARSQEGRCLAQGLIMKPGFCVGLWFNCSPPCRCLERALLKSLVSPRFGVLTKICNPAHFRGKGRRIAISSRPTWSLREFPSRQGNIVKPWLIIIMVMMIMIIIMIIKQPDGIIRTLKSCCTRWCLPVFSALIRMM